MHRLEDISMDEEQQQSRPLPLGQQLKRIMLEARVNVEVQALTDMLVAEAQRSIGFKEFDDLRDVVPTLIMNDTLWNWLTANEIRYSGAIDQTTGAYKYTLRWD